MSQVKSPTEKCYSNMRHILPYMEKNGRALRIPLFSPYKEEFKHFRKTSSVVTIADLLHAFLVSNTKASHGTRVLNISARSAPT